MAITVQTIKRLEQKIDDNSKLTSDGFSKLNGRLKKIELKEARREGVESVVKGDKINWQPILENFAKALAIGASGAYVIVQALFQ